MNYIIWQSANKFQIID